MLGVARTNDLVAVSSGGSGQIYAIAFVNLDPIARVCQNDDREIGGSVPTPGKSSLLSYLYAAKHLFFLFIDPAW